MIVIVFYLLICDKFNYLIKAIALFSMVTMNGVSKQIQYIKSGIE